MYQTKGKGSAEDRLRDYFDSAGSTAGARSWLGAWQGRVPPDPEDPLPPSRAGAAGGGGGSSGRYDEGGDGRRLRRVAQHREVRRALLALPAEQVTVLTLYYATDVGWPGAARDDAGWTRSAVPRSVRRQLGDALGRVALVTDALARAFARPGHRALSEARLLEALCGGRGGDVLAEVERQARGLRRAALLAFAAEAELRVDMRALEAGCGGEAEAPRRSKRADRLWTAAPRTALVGDAR